MGEKIRSEFVRANGLDFEVHMCGGGRRLALCLHGFPEHAYSWRYQLPVLAELGYHAWAPNLRGYGRSSRPGRVSDYHIDHLVADAVGLIDASGTEETVLIGHDWGGVIAWLVALRRARPLQRLIVMNLPHPAILLQRFWRWPQIRRSWYIFFFQLPWLPERLLGARDARAVARMFRGMAVDKSRFPEAVTDVYRRHASAPGALTAMINYYRANLRRLPSRADRAALGTVLDLPTLMIWGERDTALGKELTHGTAERVRKLTLRYLPDVSHWVQQEAPETVNAMITAWLTGKRVPEAS